MDRDCIRHCLNGHPEMYRELVGRYQAILLSYLAGQLGNRERAEEAVQETFVRAYFCLIKLKSGRIKKFNLAMRYDNPAKRYVVDGGYKAE